MGPINILTSHLLNQTVFYKVLIKLNFQAWGGTGTGIGLWLIMSILVDFVRNSFFPLISGISHNEKQIFAVIPQSSGLGSFWLTVS